MPIMRLLGRTSSINVRKVVWTAAEIGLAIAHEDHWAGPDGDTRSPDYLRLNPNGLVPVWIDDAGVLWESNSICRYLALRHGRTDLLPADPFARAQVEKWMDWQLGDLNAAWRYAFLALVRKVPGHDDPAQIARSAAAWNEKMLLLDARLAETGAFVVGSDFTVADIAIGLCVHRWRHTPIARPEAVNIDAYVDRLRARPAWAIVATEALP
jgi:glutathione S-transferase